MAKRSWFRRLIGVGAIAGAAYAVWRAIEANRPAGENGWEPQPFPFPPQPRAAPSTARPVTAPVPAPVEPRVATTIAEPAKQPEPQTDPEPRPWIDAEGGTCPVSHPVKVASGSKVFHVPGGQMYERTSAERCYRDAAAAEADGLRASKR